MCKDQGFVRGYSVMNLSDTFASRIGNRFTFFGTRDELVFTEIIISPKYI
jgi:hypothetical protein